jgi:hypothetical protein
VTTVFYALNWAVVLIPLALLSRRGKLSWTP